MFYSQKTISALILLAISTPPALASGYHFGTQSVSAQATANASSVEADTPATIFYNPAGLSHLVGTQISANIITALPKAEYTNAKGKYFTGQPILNKKNGEPLGSGTIADNPVFVPHIYASHEITPQLTAGLGLYVPFGASTKYDNSSIMRYSVKQTDLKAININPAISYDFQNGHRIGAGIIGQYMTATLAKDIDFAPAIQKRLASDPNTASLAGNIKNGAADATVTVNGDDWAFGYNLGWMWDINDQARIGLNYRSKIEHTLQGTAEWSLHGPVFNAPTPIATTTVGNMTNAAIRGAGYITKEGASVKLITPESLSLQGMLKVNPKLDLFGDITWTRHSRLNTIDITYNNDKVVPNITGKTPEYIKSNVTTLKPNWRDTYKLSLGAAYQLNDQWQIRGGVAYDQSPVRNKNDRLSTMPDNDRVWLSLGAKYNIDQNQSLDFAYSYVHVKDATANTSGYCGGNQPTGPNAINCVSDRTSASADYKSHAQFFGLQYTYRF